MSTIRFWLMPVGLVLGILMGLFVPAPGEAVGRVHLGPLDTAMLGLIVVYFITGLSLRVAGVRLRSLAAGIVIACVISLVVAPVVAWGAITWLNLEPGVALGVAVMASVPTTSSSAIVLTQIARGDLLWAASLTVVMVSVGAFTAPIAVTALMSSSADISPWPILARIAGVVLIPLFIGVLAARRIRQYPEWITLLPPLMIVIIVWVTASQSGETLLQMSFGLIVLITVLSTVAHALLLGAGALAGLPFQPPERVAMLFVVGQKTLPLALAILVVLESVDPALAGVVATAIVVAIIWHFIQLIVDSGLVRAVRQ